MFTTPSYQKRQSKRAKRLSVCVHPDQRVVVTIPKRFSLNGSVVDNFINKHSVWINQHFSNSKTNLIKKVSYPFTSGVKSYKKYKEYSRKVIEERVFYLNKVTSLNFSYKKIFIRNQKTRWGSCSSSGNLNFNYKLAFLPERLRDYVIIHELCHLKEMNHSKRYWDLVEKVLPNYREPEGELRKSYRL